MNRKKDAIIISYISMALNFLYNFFVMPMLIDALTDNYYSIYKIVQSFAGPLTLFNLGVSTIVTRAVVSCNQNDPDSVKTKQNNIALSIIASVAMAFVLFIVSLFMRAIIPSIYGNNYSPADIVIGQNVFSIFTLSIIFHVLTDAISGMVLGHRGYTYHSLISLVKILLKALLIIVFIKLHFGVIAVSFVDLMVSITSFLLFAFYAFIIAKERPKLYFFDKKKIAEIFAYAFAILLQGVVNQINNSVDTMVLGAMITEKYIITMYSCALAIYSIYITLSSMIGTYFLPDAISLVNNKANGRQLTDFIIKPGRFQAMIAVAVLAVFGANGAQFINLWIGEKYGNAYYIAMILLIPVTIPQVQNVAVAILDATLKRKYRSIILFVMALLNLLLTICLVKVISYWGAAIATAISLVVGHGLLMNLYYRKEFKIEIGRMFGSIFHKTLLCGLISAAFIFLANKFIITPVLSNGWLSFITSCGIQFLLYVTLLYFWGMNSDEKAFVNRHLRRR